MHPEPKLKFYFPTDVIFSHPKDTGNRSWPRIKLTDKLSNVYTNFLGCHSEVKMNLNFC